MQDLTANQMTFKTTDGLLSALLWQLLLRPAQEDLTKLPNIDIDALPSSWPKVSGINAKVMIQVEKQCYLAEIYWALFRCNGHCPGTLNRPVAVMQPFISVKPTDGFVVHANCHGPSKASIFTEINPQLYPVYCNAYEFSRFFADELGGEPENPEMSICNTWAFSAAHSGISTARTIAGLLYATVPKKIENIDLSIISIGQLISGIDSKIVDFMSSMPMLSTFEAELSGRQSEMVHLPDHIRNIVTKPITLA